ncbi:MULTISPECIES: cytochrome b/b6 domain-containing protein [unclassified Methylophilus]|uniref:cytochrome b/b6 domain-containing protein n=1 Tax=unclassified Methylophilus TaxID=2630143 RepID=UPI0006FBC30A|nr:MULTISPECIES: cytochrome b/b6 domain-containing protein [unclassified Methylophilus]KQT42303.1 cytochrome B [Methylophilus sp. Leaf416]KQT56485.1 cytochrome B [Methylophilus sp. Leaf459]
MDSSIIWPWWVRLSHWLVASGVIALWLMSYLWYETDFIHRSLGYSIVVAIFGRILLGNITQFEPARFYWPGIDAIRLHLTEIRWRQMQSHKGHNPLGQWAVYLMWFLIAALAITGWLSRTDALWGEDWPVQVHTVLSYSLLALVSLHVLAVFCISKLSGQHLLSQMIHGRYAHLNQTKAEN